MWQRFFIGSNIVKVSALYTSNINILVILIDRTQTTTIVHFRIGEEQAEIIHISEPIKSHWAQEKGLDLVNLLSDGPYKEKYRKEMIIWSDIVRQRDPGYFCRASIEKSMQ